MRSRGKVDEQPPRDVADSPSALPGIVLVGTSAGGLHALQVVLGALPADFPLPVAVVQHLDPRHRSLMVDILNRHAAMPVRAARDGERPAPGTITIAVPDHHVIIDASGRIALTQTEPVRFVRPSIDRLFESAAAAHGRSTVGVVLTGTGSDGAAGADAIHAAGGTVLVQDPETAEFAAMPTAVVNTGCADQVLALDAIAPALVALATRQDAT